MTMIDEQEFDLALAEECLLEELNMELMTENQYTETLMQEYLLSQMI